MTPTALAACLPDDLARATLVGRIWLSTTIAPWHFGVRALCANLQWRGLLGG